MSADPTPQAPGGTVRVALVQLTSGRDVDRNIVHASEFIREAAAKGAHYVQTPEVTNIMELERERLLAATETEDANRALAAFTDLARDLGIWLHIGSLAIKTRANPDKLVNRSYLIAPDGAIAARYDKIHMFDVTLADGEIYSESDNYRGGTEAVCADLPWGRLGLTICYDLRFPYLHRALAHAGAVFIASPAAFTRTTGQAHWHTLIRARAIETETFLLAAGQTGLHEHGRKTYGHSLIVSPWGDILAEAGDEPCTIAADLDLSLVETCRRRLPSLTHDRTFEVVVPEGEVKAPLAEPGARG